MKFQIFLIARMNAGGDNAHMVNPISELRKLPLHERLQLVEDLWDSIAIEDANLSVPQWQKDELDRRAAKFEVDPATGIPWEIAKGMIRGHHV